MGLGCLSGRKAKLGLPRAIMGSDKSLNQSLQGGLKKKKATRVVMGHQGIAIKYRTNT